MDKRLVTRMAAVGAILVVAAGGAYGLASMGGAEGSRGLVPASETKGELVDLDWEHLMPEEDRAAFASGVVQHEQLTDEMSPFQQMTDVTKVRADLDGERVRIPGYMTPLSFDDAEVGEFLLVPYVGACVHVPPPPANQIVYVTVEGTVPVLEMWEPFLAVGTLRTDPRSTELAEVAYTMELEHLELYEEPEVEVYDDLAGAEPS